MNRTTRFKALLAQRNGLVIPGCHDALSARQVETLGFPATYLSGFSASSVMGIPDVGLMDLRAMAARTAEVSNTVHLPLLVDGDDGYGGPDAVADCVRALETAGAVGVHIDDQILPRTPGNAKTLVSLTDMTAKITAALAARRDPDFTVIGRTDAMATDGFEEALRRARALEAAGADALMIMYLTEIEQVRLAAAALTVPLVLVVTETARKSFAARDLDGAGHAAVIYTVTTLLTGLAAQHQALSHLARVGDTQALEPRMLPIGRVRELTTRHDGPGIAEHDRGQKPATAKTLASQPISPNDKGES